MLATTLLFPVNIPTHHTSIVLEVQVDTVRSSPRLALTDDNGGHDLLSQLGLSLFDSGHDHVTHTSSGQTVQARTDTLDGDDVKVASTGVVAAVHHGAAKFQQSAHKSLFLQMPEPQFFQQIESSISTASSARRKRRKALNVHRQTESHLELVAGGTATTVEENKMSAPNTSQIVSQNEHIISILAVFLQN